MVVEDEEEEEGEKAAPVKSAGKEVSVVKTS